MRRIRCATRLRNDKALPHPVRSQFALSHWIFHPGAAEKLHLPHPGQKSRGYQIRTSPEIVWLYPTALLHRCKTEAFAQREGLRGGVCERFRALAEGSKRGTKGNTPQEPKKGTAEDGHEYLRFLGRENTSHVGPQRFNHFQRIQYNPLKRPKKGTGMRNPSLSAASSCSYSSHKDGLWS